MHFHVMLQCSTLFAVKRFEEEDAREGAESLLYYKISLHGGMSASYEFRL